jgi:SAM-dependent methyltransferase
MVCGERNYDILWTKDGFNYVRCCECSSVRVDPQLLVSEVARIYSVGFSSKQFSQIGAQTDSPYHKRLLKQMRVYRQSGNILDVGCFTGKFLSAAKDVGWKPFGLDVSKEAVEQVRSKLGIDVRHDTLLRTNFIPDMFDAITMYDVIEHFQEPLPNLKMAAKLLRPQGLLYIETPNFNGIPRYVLGRDWCVFFPWHFYYYTERTIRHILELAGFRVKKIQAIDIRPLSRFNAFRSLQNSGNISGMTIAKRLKKISYVNSSFKLLRAAYYSYRHLGNFPLRGLSLLDIHLGSKLIIWAERL